ncbi:MAG: DUF1700 domain-containing protein [Eubacterium sp.]|nr:DUF1700 domain-containing protein [Eubacterium sp.]
MSKQEFIESLKSKLSGLPQDEIDERIAFYSEMIDDRMEEGVTEEEAVEGIGSVDSIVEQTMKEIPLTKLVKEKVTPKRGLKAWEIVLLVLGSPIWIPLMIAAGAIIFSVYVVIWSLVITVYSVTVSFAASTVASLPLAFSMFLHGNPAGAFFAIGSGLALAGLSILMFMASVAVTKAIVVLTKRFALWVKSLFVKKEGTDYEHE